MMPEYLALTELKADQGLIVVVCRTEDAFVCVDVPVASVKLLTPGGLTLMADRLKEYLLPGLGRQMKWKAWDW